MEPTEADRELLSKIIDNGGSVRLEGNVDHRPYMRLQIGWPSSQNHNLQETVYSVTLAGSAANGR
ncbi:hypothetical protein [Bradyrhizobium erythrophlei]|uniref:hypothetical protein n=1 Tax=Bradyrhizobium erythrophlei TaxID=1437360 RepID=UPI00115FD490|nr:hypothetical protein [Bradyrhizobium erythrophlei]